MPELPEVETVRRGLERLLPPGTRIARVELRRSDLRARLPGDLDRRLAGQEIRSFRRLGKYLLWDTPGVVLISHLGMSGSWRLGSSGDERPHDHVILHLADGRRVVYRDPRRFGVLDLAEPGAEHRNRWLEALGPDPLDDGVFHLAHLRAAFRGRRAAVKALLLDQRLVAGVGNIYVAESLFRAGIRPAAAAGRLTAPRLQALIRSLRAVLLEAIAAGGSTIRDFGSAEGGSGYFQHRFRVYGREGEPCLACGRKLRSTRIAQRATAWCAGCQT